MIHIIKSVIQDIHTIVGLRNRKVLIEALFYSYSLVKEPPGLGPMVRPGGDFILKWARRSWMKSKKSPFSISRAAATSCPRGSVVWFYYLYSILRFRFHVNDTSWHYKRGQFILPHYDPILCVFNLSGIITVLVINNRWNIYFINLFYLK
jgi:hypothetical protein